MKKQSKLSYLSPVTEALVVQSESVVLSGGSPYGGQGAAGNPVIIITDPNDF